MTERKMIEIYQEIHSHLNNPATVHLLRREAPELLEYMGLWARDLGDIVLASRKISIFTRVVVTIVKAFGFGDKVPRDILLALVNGTCGSEAQNEGYAFSHDLCNDQVKKLEMRGPEPRRKEFQAVRPRGPSFVR